MQFSGGAAGRAMLDLATDPTRFRRGPASEGKDLAEIAKQYDLHKELAFVEETTAFSDLDARKVYHMQTAKGGNAYVFLGNDGTLWLDRQEMRVPDGGPVQGGDLVTQAAMTFARNNGLRVRPDPKGVSEIAQRRDLSHMLSSALRHQTTAHLMPNGTHLKTGEAFENIPGWQEGDTRSAFEHNADLLAKAEHEAAKAIMQTTGETRLEDLRWDPVSDNVIHGPTGRRLSTRAFNQIVSRLDPGGSGVGATTLSRALITKAALEGHIPEGDRIQYYRLAESDAGGGVSDRSSDQVFELLARKELFYSQPGGSQGVATLGSQSSGAGELGKVIADGTRFLNRVLPGLIHDKTHIFHSVEELLKSDYGRGRYNEDERLKIQGADGFFDPRTKDTVIIAGNIVPRAGETPRQAFARVVLHERVGHDGTDYLLSSNPRFAARWTAILRRAQNEYGTELDAIASEADYAHLAGKEDQLLLEWFARRVENNPALLERPGMLREVWQALRELVADLQATLGLKVQKGSAFDDQVRDLMFRARRAALEGINRATTPGSADLTFNSDIQFSQTARAREQIQQNLAQQAIESILLHEPGTAESMAGLRPDGSGGNAQSAREATRALLGGSPEASFGWDRDGGRRRRGDAERAYLRRLAKPETDKGEKKGSGGEHTVFHRSGEDRVTKATHSGNYGQVLDQMGPEQGYRLNLRPALPSEYLIRVGLANKIFGDGVRLVGYEHTPDGPSIVTTQPFLEGPHPSKEQVDTTLRALGFEPLSERLYDTKTLNKTKRPWYRARDGVMIVDAKRQNFVLHNGKVLPVGLMIQIMPDEVLNRTRAARQR